MKTGKKLITGTLSALCAALLVLCSVLAIGWSKAAKTNDTALPEVRNNGTAIQWKYSNETDWHDLVALSELQGAAGENGKDGANGENGVDGKNGMNGLNGSDGKDGINGAPGKDGSDGKDGKDGIDGKSIEVQRAETHIQWRYEGDEWQNLVAIADITGPAGQNGKDGANGKTPEFRVSENTLQWHYATKVTPATRETREIREIRATKATRATPVRTVAVRDIFAERGMYRQPIFQTVQFPCTIGKCITAAGLYRTTEQHSG